MSKAGGVSRQWSDLLAYVLFPVMSVLTPASWSRRVLGRISAWKSVLPIDASLALEGARKHLDINDEIAWQQLAPAWFWRRSSFPRVLKSPGTG
jgi:hypothetical protein